MVLVHHSLSISYLSNYQFVWQERLNQNSSHIQYQHMNNPTSKEEGNIYEIAAYRYPNVCVCVGILPFFISEAWELSLGFTYA